MNHLKAYEQYNYNIDNKSIVKFLNKVIKKINDKNYKYSIYFSSTNRISIYENSNQDFTEIISQMSIHRINEVLTFNVYNPKFTINEMLIKYFSISMKLIFEKDYSYSFKFDRNTKLNINDFEVLSNSNKYNI